MCNVQCSEEVKEGYIESMGESLGKAFHLLWQELAWVYSNWRQYVDLFGTDPDYIEFMNKAAPRFFRMVQDVLWEESLLHIARLTDSPKSCCQENLTIKMLPDLIVDPELSKTVKQLLEKAVETSAFCRDWRNRRIAHRDLNLALKEKAEPLKAASRLKVKEALKSIEDVLNAVSDHYNDSMIMFDVPGPPGGAMALLHILKSGLTVR